MSRIAPCRFPFGGARHSASIVLIALVAGLACVSTARGQTSWEYSPYQVRVLVALEATARFPATLSGTLNARIAARSAAVLGAVWRVEVISAPGKLRGLLLDDLEQLTADRVVATLAAKELADKVYLAAVGWRGGLCRMQVRELDGRSRQLGPVIERSVPAIEALPLALWDAVSDSFTPLVRIEQLEGTQIVARLRAGGLITDPSSIANVEPGMALRPVVRRNDRSGQPMKGGVQAIPWTVLTIEGRHDSLLDCTVHSGLHTPIPPRGGTRIERLGLLVRPRYESTRLVLESRTEAGKPLVGYEISSREPGSEDIEPLGSTDALGAITVPRGDGGLRTLVVRNGQQLLVRLPFIPGQAEELTARIVDDDGRLAAEGFVAALSSRTLDLAARREILAARIRVRIKSGKADEAQQLLDDFRRLETRADLNRDLNLYRQQAFSSDKLTQNRIERLFAEAQKLLLLPPLSDVMLSELTHEITVARAAGE